MDNTSLARISWVSYFWAIIAVARKDWFMFKRYPLNAVFRVVQPVIWLTPIYFMGKTFSALNGGSGFKAYTGTGDYMTFILLGSIVSNFVSSVFWGMGYSLKTEMDSGVLESNWMTPVPRALLLVGQTLANIFITIMTSTAILIVGALLFGFQFSGNLLYALVTVLPMIIALYGFGFAFAGVVLLMRDANTLVDVSDYLVSMFSGQSFPVRVLPGFLLPISLAIPLTYGLDAFRGFVIHGRTIIPLQYELMILFGFMVVMVPLGYWVFRRIERRVRTLGTLALH